MSDILDAYLATDYVVLAPGGEITVRIGQRIEAVESLLRAHGARSAIILTAWNPRSEALSREDNDRRQACLVAELAEKTMLPAEGRGTGGDWPPEVSVCVFDLAFDVASRLADAYGQTAFVAIDARGLAWLVTRPPGVG